MSLFNNIHKWLMLLLMALSTQALAIELVVWEDIGKGQALSKAADDFTSLTGVKVKIVEFRYIYALERLRLDGPAGTGPDVLLLPVDLLGSAVSEGMISPIYITPKEKSRYVEKALIASTYKDELYMLPKNIESLALFYNKKLLEKPFDTLDEYYNFAKELRRIDKYGFVAKFDDLYYAYTVLGPYGAYIFDKKKYPASKSYFYDIKNMGLAGEGAVEGVKVLSKFFNEHLFPSYVEGRSDFNSVVNLFAKGKTASAILGSYDLMTIKNSNIDFGTAPMPILPNGKRMHGFFGVRGYAISHWSSKYNLAVKFAKFVTQDQYSLDRYSQTLELPATVDALKSEVIKDSPYASAFIEECREATIIPSVPATPEVWIPYAEKLHKIFSRKSPLEQGLKDVEEEIKRNIDAQNEQYRYGYDGTRM